MRFTFFVSLPLLFPKISPLGMGMSWASLQEKQIQGRRWKERQVKKITGMAFVRLMENSKKPDKEALIYEEVYIAVLRLYIDINKYLPGPHYDPPSEKKLKAMIDEHDVDRDGLLDRDEFAEFIQKLMAESLRAISVKLVITFVAAPTLAMATKRATRNVPGLGKVMRKVPNAVYASTIALGIVMLQKSA